MKKQALLITGLAVLSSSAFASKARMEALGQDGNEGSLFIQDTRRIFKNPAYVNVYKNFAMVELGSAVTTDAEGSPRAEGGVFREAGNFVYGLYFGREADDVTSRADYLAEDNRLELTLGGDAGVQWGATLEYSNNKDEQTAAFEMSQTGFALKAGMIMGALEAYTHLDISDESEGQSTGVAGDKWEQGFGLVLGASYDMNDWTFFGEYDMASDEETVTGTVTENDYNTMTLGAGHTKEVDSNSRLFTSVTWENTTTENKVGAAAATETKQWILPVAVAFEADATSWMTVRASVKQNILSNNENTTSKKKTVANSTSVNAGMTFNWGKIKVDGSVTAANEVAGELHLDELASRVGVSYWF